MKDAEIIAAIVEAKRKNPDRNTCALMAVRNEADGELDDMPLSAVAFKAFRVSIDCGRGLIRGWDGLLPPPNRDGDEQYQRGYAIGVAAREAYEALLR